MGWTIQYKATAYEGNIKEFIDAANSSNLKLSWGSEHYFWEQSDESSATGFTKIQYSWRKKSDFIRIISELQKIAEEWPKVRITAADDYVLGDWYHVKNINLNELPI